jgi:hypothetical protein
MFERRALLQEVVAYDSETIALGKDDRFFVYRAVLETKNQMAGHPITMGNLCDFTIGEGVAC